MHSVTRSGDALTPCARLLTWLGVLSGVLGLAACTPDAQGRSSSRLHAGRHQAGRVNGCVRLVRGASYGPGLVLPTWLPLGFRLSNGPQVGVVNPTETYVRASNVPDEPRIELGFANYGGLLSRFSDRAPHQASVTIDGHPGRLDTGASKLVRTYWKPDRVHLLSVTGYRIPVSVVMAVARNIWFDPPGKVQLPLRPGHIVSRRAAVRAARRLAGRAGRSPGSRAVAKLTSWAEVVALLQTAHSAQAVAGIQGAAVPARWQSAWVVRTGGVSAIVNASTGRPVATVRGQPSQAWFTALTDRSRTSASCQGGSRARLPFGILTRDEESYVVQAYPAPASSHASTSISLKLTTVPAMNTADPGIDGGCVGQNCLVKELVWVAITTVRAPPGTTIPCLPSSTSVPHGYQLSQVRLYYGVAVPGNLGIFCRKLPGPIKALTDLAPPAS